MRTLLSETTIQTRVQTLGKEIQVDYQDKPLLVLGVLTGCLIFLSDLIRQMDSAAESRAVAGFQLSRSYHHAGRTELERSVGSRSRRLARAVGG